MFSFFKRNAHICYQSALFNNLMQLVHFPSIVKILLKIVKNLRSPFMELALCSDLAFVNTNNNNTMQLKVNMFGMHKPNGLHE